MLGNPYCGDSMPTSRISSSNHLFFHFHSNSYKTGTGFKLEYYATSKQSYKVDSCTPLSLELQKSKKLKKKNFLWFSHIKICTFQAWFLKTWNNIFWANQTCRKVYMILIIWISFWLQKKCLHPTFTSNTYWFFHFCTSESMTFCVF